jgi:hypothetical protein
MSMATTPVPGGVERNVVQPIPYGPGADRRENGFDSLASHASECDPPNQHIRDSQRGVVSLAGSIGAVQPPNHVFDVGMAKMPQPQSVVEYGKGMVPTRADGRMAASTMKRGR